MEEKQLDAFIVPSTDAHLSEYPPKYWESRKWISGFTGSAGTAVITKDKAGVWTDSRYFLQAADELDGTGFDLFKMGQADTPEMTDWIIEQVGHGGTVGIDGLVYAASEGNALKSRLEAVGIKRTPRSTRLKSSGKNCQDSQEQGLHVTGRRSRRERDKQDRPRERGAEKAERRWSHRGDPRHHRLAL